MTLLELLLAVLAFGLLAASAYGALQSLAITAQDQRLAAERLATAQLFGARMQRELEQAVAWEHPGGLNGLGLAGTVDALQFTTLAGADPQSDPVIVIVEYRTLDQSLLRATIATVEGTAPRAPAAVLEEASSVAFSYLGRSGGWRPDWAGTPREPLPRAVRLTVESGATGRIERVFELPEVQW